MAIIVVWMVVLNILADAVYGGSIDLMGAALFASVFGAVVFVVNLVRQQAASRTSSARNSR